MDEDDNGKVRLEKVTIQTIIFAINYLIIIVTYYYHNGMLHLYN